MNTYRHFETHARADTLTVLGTWSVLSHVTDINVTLRRYLYTHSFFVFPGLGRYTSLSMVLGLVDTPT
jgi:hypothetical protein